MARKTFDDFYGDLSCEDDQQPNLGDGESHASNQAPNLGGNDEVGNTNTKRGSPKTKADLKSETYPKQEGKFKGSDTTNKKDTSAKDDFGSGAALGHKNVGENKPSMPSGEKSFDRSEAATPGTTSYDFIYRGRPKNDPNPFFFNMPKLPDEIIGKTVEKLHMTVNEDSKELEIHTEYAGGSGPRLYRYTHNYANKIKDVPKTADGDKITRTEQDVLSGPTTICGYCKKKDSNSLRRCVRCMAISYCGKECQRTHFNDHKLFCKRCERFDIARARVWPALRFYRDLQHEKDYSVLLRDLPTEEQYGMGLWRNLLVEVVGRLFHWKRFSCQVTDLAGERTRIIFHDPSTVYKHPVYESPKPQPMSLEDCLKPGQFLLLMGAHWRLFMDGAMGIRINDLNSVYLIKMDDFEIPKEYKKGASA